MKNPPKLNIPLFLVLFVCWIIPAIVYVLYFLIKSYIYSKQTHGFIELYGLQSWWELAFSKNEQKKLKKSFGKYLTFGKVENEYSCRSNFLTTLAEYTKDNALRYKICKFAYENVSEEKLINKYWALHDLISLFKALKDYEDSQKLFLESCEAQIKISRKAFAKLAVEIPDILEEEIHMNGFDELIVYYRKQKNASKVEELQKQAISDGWAIKKYKTGIGAISD
ncbi:MAG: hypothetical protein E7035_01520 [Verrucomicrobiaceae bacterium]|nr:hypothetical protein [Verrucomicrobiaceae bacterium]